ncbi:MAG: sulfotransferase family 2 domain-containing protein [Paracoccaceae bacterium]
MADRYDYFVLFAEMRTGSNFLESTLNDIPGLTCHGEVFNPHFVGYPNKADLFGTTLQARESDPLALISRMKHQTDGLAGFRFFHDHDPRALKECLSDPRCAKIILTRNLLDTYVSREIVRQTGQWRLNDLKHAKSAQIIFNAGDFQTHIADRQAFQQKLQHRLQISGQTAFYIGYDDINDVEVLNGLIRFLGISHGLKSVSAKTKKQNPRSLQDSVINFAEMELALTQIDPFSLNATPNFEPRRGANVPGYIAAKQLPLLYMPTSADALPSVSRWLAEIDGATDDDLIRGFSQKTLRQWKRQRGNHRCFTVIRHPVARLYDAFNRRILMPGPDQFTEIREVLRKYYKLPIPKDAPDANYSKSDHRAAFIAFARFVKGNLDAQTSVRVDGSWASQSETIKGMGQFALPDHIFREDTLQSELDQLAAQFGATSPTLSDYLQSGPYPLADIYTKDVEAAVKAAYQRDYMMFGFGAWTQAA